MDGKRSSTELGEGTELAPKRVRMGDLESVLRSQVSASNSPNPMKSKVSECLRVDKEEMSQVIEVPITADSNAAQLEKSGRNTLPIMVVPTVRPLDLNVNVGAVNNLESDNNTGTAENFQKASISHKQDTVPHGSRVVTKCISLDLNAQDVSSSVNQDPFYSYKSNHTKAYDVSECGSTTGSQEEKDPLSIWKEMKQNGFLSSSHGGIPTLFPKQRARKNKSEMNKRRVDIAKKEQVDRFTKIAAPSGLLNDLNPGIINHVRNRKQVHSIIEALVKSEKHENNHSGSKRTSHAYNGNKEAGNRKDLGKRYDSEEQRFCFAHEDGPSHVVPGARQAKTYSAYPIISGNRGGDGNLSMAERASRMQSSSVNEGDVALKLSSTKITENTSSLSHEESANLASVSSLSVKAATIASQWLELLHQDIKGRLAALRRSKKRVRAVINTELPFLISKEFSSNQENDPYVLQSSGDGVTINSTADMHQAKWRALFNQMDETLSEEEGQLVSTATEMECWMNKVRDMQMHCDQGLQQIPWHMFCGQHQLGTSDNDCETKKIDSPEGNLAIRAAAASIYSTCNFLLSKENVSC